MKGLYFSDKHDHPFNEFSRPTKGGRTTLLDEHYQTYDWIAEQIVEHRPDFVVNLGDTVFTIGYVDALTITCVEYGDQAIRQACKVVGATYYPMLGNHDIMNDATRIHVLPFVKGLVTEASMVMPDLFFFPFYRDWEPVWQQNREKVLSIARRAYIHLDISGARFNRAAVCKSGIAPADFPGTCRVVAGHFHHPQVLTRNFFCIGSCMYRDFRDEVVDEPRGIVVDDLDTGDWLRIENPHTSIYHNLKVVGEEDLQEKLGAIPHKERTFVRLSYPEALEPFVKPYKNDFRCLKTMPVKEKRTVLVNGGPGEEVSSFDPHKVLERYLTQNPPDIGILPEGGFDINRYVEYLGYVTGLVERTLGTEQKLRARHQVQQVSLHAENFMGFLNLDLRFDESGVVYVDGVIRDQEADVSNGSGKSTMFEALHWCWFGELIRSSKEVEGRVLIDDVVNDQVKSNCLVSNTVIVDGTEYQILRTRKHKEYGSDLRIFMDGSDKPVAQGLEAAKKYLEQITGVTADLSRYIMFLVDSLSTRFSQLGGKARLELLEDVIQLSLYDKLYDAAHKDLTTAQGQYNGSKASIDRDAQVLKELRQQRENLAANLSQIIANLEATIAQKQAELAGVRDQVTNLDTDIRNKDVIASMVAKEVEAARTAIPKFDESAYQKTLRDLNRDIALLTKLKSDKEALANGTCPTCNRPYEPSPILKAEIEKVTNDLATYQTTLSQWMNWEAAERVRIKTFQDAYTEKSQSKEVVDGKIRILRAQKPGLEVRVRTLQSDIQDTTQILEGNKSQLAVLDKRIKDVEVELESLSASLEEISSRVRVRAYWDTALSPKGGCRMSLLQDALGQLSEYSVDYSNLISNGRVSPQIFITPKGEVGFEVTQLVGQRKYGLSSSGQRRMVDLGIQLALARLSSKYSGFTSNLMILDEVEDKLDASARRHLVTLLTKIAEEENKLILIASHNKDIKSYVERVWLVEQTDGVSRLAAA